ncbi:MAG: glycosyltransferase family 1 protein [Terracidiphilus sp.]|jgi:glycosyltransferase involved in cell wall biosynthesis
MKVLLVGNYEFDGSTSMRIWADALHRELLQAGIDVRVISPRPVFGKLKPSAHGIGKWLGYIDRFVIFPSALRSAAAQADIVHLCDHGSAVYVSTIKGKPVIATCHDMIAVRGARGELPELRSSRFGQLQQRWICEGLRHATRVACVSRATFDDACRNLGTDRNLCIVLNGLNYPFRPLASSEVDRRLANLGTIRAPFVLHLGSNLAYKNREGVLRTFAKASASTNLQLVIAGKALTRDLTRLAHELQIEDRTVQIVKPDVAVIEALYNRAVCLLFPSRYEGFGWPPIEAQACGCPVVASNIAPFAETLGQSAVLKRVGDEAGMAEAIGSLASDREFREQVRQKGFANVRTRFQTSRMIGEYVSLYRELIRTDE